MKKVINNLAFPLLAIFICVLLVSYNSGNPGNNSDSTPVGTVIYSVLPPQAFLRINEGWAVLDGTALNPDWELSKKINSNNLQILDGKLPDASGMFLRAMNYDNIGADPEKRSVGSKQNDNFKSHRHYLDIESETAESDHTHNYNSEFINYTLEYNSDQNYYTNHAHNNAEPTWLYYSKITKWDYKNDYNRSVTGSGKHKHKITYKGFTENASAKIGEKETYIGDVETRPKNISLYVYIKVN